MEIVSQIFNTLGQIAQSFGTLLVGLFETAVSLFWREGEGSSGGQLTVLGIFMLIGMASGLFIWAFRYIKQLIRVHTK